MLINAPQQNNRCLSITNQMGMEALGVIIVTSPLSASIRANRAIFTGLADSFWEQAFIRKLKL